MSRIRLANSGILLALGLALAAAASAASAGICDEVQTLFQASASDRVDNDFFDAYHVTRKGGVYKVYASKRVSLELASIAAVMNDLEVFDQFMPGYQDIDVRRDPGSEILTAIEFAPSFSPFDSRFTNEVEIEQGAAGYRQCWRQLDPKDERVQKKFDNAPETNSGFWNILRTGDGRIEITYFSAIEPPVRIPGFLYKWILENSYQDAFEAIIDRTAAVGAP